MHQQNYEVLRLPATARTPVLQEDTFSELRVWEKNLSSFVSLRRVYAIKLRQAVAHSRAQQNTHIQEQRHLSLQGCTNVVDTMGSTFQQPQEAEPLALLIPARKTQGL